MCNAQSYVLVVKGSAGRFCITTLFFDCITTLCARVPSSVASSEQACGRWAGWWDLGILVVMLRIICICSSVGPSYRVQAL